MAKSKRKDSGGSTPPPPPAAPAAEEKKPKTGMTENKNGYGMKPLLVIAGILIVLYFLGVVGHGNTSGHTGTAGQPATPTVAALDRLTEAVVKKTEQDFRIAVNAPLKPATVYKEETRHVTIPLKKDVPTNLREWDIQPDKELSIVCGPTESNLQLAITKKDGSYQRIIGDDSGWHQLIGSSKKNLGRNGSSLLKDATEVTITTDRDEQIQFTVIRRVPRQ